MEVNKNVFTVSLTALAAKHVDLELEQQILTRRAELGHADNERQQEVFLCLEYLDQQIETTKLNGPAEMAAMMGSSMDEVLKHMPSDVREELGYDEDDDAAGK